MCLQFDHFKLIIAATCVYSYGIFYPIDNKLYEVFVKVETKFLSVILEHIVTLWRIFGFLFCLLHKIVGFSIDEAVDDATSLLVKIFLKE